MVALLVLLGCNQAPCGPWFRDADRDGFGLESESHESCTIPPGWARRSGDCDDADPAIRPGAEDVCDRRDNDCDGASDNGPDATTWFADADGDGYGNGRDSVRDCAIPEGYSADSTDCDDTRALARPGAVERCDGFDDDCDGRVDESGGGLWYADADGDGYGGGPPIAETCDVPAGAAGNADDCDDADARAHPYAAETLDGADEDCDGAVDEGLSHYDLLVDCAGGGDFLRIQDAIDAAIPGQRIAIGACGYAEAPDYRGKTLDVFGLDAAEDTVIDGGGAPLRVGGGEGPGTRLANVTLVNAGVEITEASLSLEDVSIRPGATPAVTGTAAFVDLRHVSLVGGERADAVVRLDGGSLTIDGSDIECGAAPVGVAERGTLILRDSSISCPGGVGVRASGGELSLRRARISGGTIGVEGEDDPASPDERLHIANGIISGGSTGIAATGETLRVVNSVVWGAEAGISVRSVGADSLVTNSVVLHSGCGVLGDGLTRLETTWSAFWRNDEDACDIEIVPTYTSNPLFKSFPHDLGLGVWSELIDGGDPGSAWNDPDGTRNDVGRYGGPDGDW